MGQFADVDSDLRRPVSRWRSRFTWLGLLAAAWAVYEVTSEPALGTAVICLKVAGDDVRTAGWLWRNDPWLARGRAFWWLHVAFGSWKSVAVAAVTECVAVAGSRLVGSDRLLEVAVGALALVWAASTVAFLAGTVAVELARRSGVRLWLYPPELRAPQRAQRSPVEVGSGQDNFLYRMLGSAAAAPAVGAVGVAAVVLSVWLPLWVALPLPATAALTAVVLYNQRYRPVVAASPAECWSTDPASEPGDASRDR